MCPLPNRGINRITTERRVSEWLSTALCCISLFRQHRISKRIVCDECFGDENPTSQALYVDVSRHYLHIGPGELFETCQECDATIPRSRISNTCLVCRIALSDFEEYLCHSRDRPFDDAEPTIIAIAETHSRQVGTN